VKTLVGAAEPEPRPSNNAAMPIAVSSHTITTGASGMNVSVTVNVGLVPAPVEDRQPYRTQAYVDRRPELEAGPNGVPKEEPNE